MMSLGNKQFISHRGNLNGPDERENEPAFIAQALNKGFSVEVDVWIKDNIFYLGHDSPKYKTSFTFLNNPSIWCHCKNFEALDFLTNIQPHANFFWHSDEKMVVTSQGYIWHHSNNHEHTCIKSIIVLPERYNITLYHKPYYGICSDNIVNYKKEYGHV